MNLLEQLISYHTTKRIPKEEYPTRVYKLLKEQGFDPDSIKYVHITGSKGKGSLAFNTFSLLKAKGHKVGLFTSPHIFDVRERFITNDGMISESQLENLIQQYLPLLQSKELHFFEICLFLAIVYFLDCEYVVLEVGVGGRYDPTNFCKPIVSLLGHISVEHRDFLGDTIEKIAYDKAGIIKDGIPAFSVDQDDIVKNIFGEGVRYYSDIIKIDNYRLENNKQIFDLRTLDKEIPNISLNRIGKAHVINFALSVASMMSVLDDFDNQWIYTVAEQKFPYRVDMINENTIVDTAHNGASFENLLRALEEISWGDVVLYVTILQGKEIKDIANVLTKYRHLINKIEFFEFDTKGNRKTDVRALYELVKNDVKSVYRDDISDIALDPNTKKVFAGSFYSVPSIMTKIQRI